MTLHISLMLIAGATLLIAVFGNALGYWRLSPSIWPVGQTIIRLGMSVAGVSCIATVVSSALLGTGWRERVHWELAADAGFALLSIWLLVGAAERDLRARRAARDEVRQRQGGD
jgi:hypothetical protein